MLGPWEPGGGQTGNVHKTEVRECALRLSGVVRGVDHGWDDEASLKEVGGVPDPEGRAQERDDVPGAHPQEDRVLDRHRGGSVNDDGPTQPRVAGCPGEPLEKLAEAPPRGHVVPGADPAVVPVVQVPNGSFGKVVCPGQKLDDVVPFGAGHCENERVGEEHPPTDGAAVIRVGLEEVAELVGVEEPVGGAVGARACGGEGRGWMCPRRGGGASAWARCSARTGGAWGGPWLEERGRPGACEVAGWGGG